MNIPHQTHNTVTNFITYLPTNNSNNIDIKWKYNDIDIFNKYTQFKDTTGNVKEIVADTGELRDAPGAHPGVQPDVSSSAQLNEPTNLNSKSNVTKVTKPKEINRTKEVTNNVVKTEVLKVEIVPYDNKKIKSNDKTKKDELSPIEYRMAHCSASIIAKDYIKQNLIEIFKALRD